MALVGLNLVEGRCQRGVLIAGVLQLQHGNGQAIEKQNNVGPPVLGSFNQRELIDAPANRCFPAFRNQPTRLSRPRCVHPNDIRR